MRVPIGDTSVDRLLINLAPICLLNWSNDPVATAVGTDSVSYVGRLMRSENNEPQTCLDQRAHYVVVAGCLRQPNRFRLAPEAMTKIGQAPLNLGAQIVFITQR